MIDVKLEVVRDSYIKAPLHCPYKREFDEDCIDKECEKKSFVVNSNLCNLCKICNFTPLINIDIKEADFAKYLTYTNENIYTSIFKQTNYLKKQERIPLVILISPSLFDEMLTFVYSNNTVNINVIRSYFYTHQKPLCHILGCPVYVSPKLTRSNIMVVGEIEWR